LLSKNFSIDEIDRDIFELIQENPNLTHVEIGKKVNRSQPIIGMRIRKLKKAGILTFQAGINIKNSELILARVDLFTLFPVNLENLIKNCPYMINGFRQSGKFNFSILLLGVDIKLLDRIVNRCFRNNPDIEQVLMNVVIDIVNDLVLPFNVSCKGCENLCGRFHCFKENGDYKIC
jgi:DNA-binding Lrp family transcriptional regulator